MLGGATARASLTFSARTRYRLMVNGVIVGCGPGRSYPEFREADTYDLAPHLRTGANRIEVEVLHVAFATFHHLAETPGFIAWGQVVETGGPLKNHAAAIEPSGDGAPSSRTQDVSHATVGACHDLTTPGAWRCRRRAGVNEDAPRLSFAQGPVEVVDQRIEPDGDAAAWVAPVPADPGLTPILRPRIIPALTRLPLAAAELRQAPVPDDEALFAAWVTAEGDGPNPEHSHGRMAVARAWIYSPQSQTVRCGSWWGEYWLNGKPLAKTNDASRPLRQTMDLHLQAGWNRLLAVGEICFGYWECCLAWPRGAGLALRTAPRDDAPAGVERAGPVSRATLDAVRTGFLAGDALPALAWRVAAHNAGGTPLRQIAWSSPVAPPTAATWPLALPSATPGLVAADMGQLVLGSIALDIEAPAGTIVDIGHAEQLAVSGRPDYAKTVTMYSADRFVLRGGRQRIETFNPRGFRHLELLVHGHTEPVTLHGLGAIETHYPYAFTGTFECSDPDFNRLWAFGRRTLELCSDDVLVDCPWRERTLYGGDLLAEMAVTAALTRDLRLVKRSLDVLLQSLSPATGWLQSMAPMHRDRKPLADYPLLVAIATAWLVRLTDDAPFAARAWPVFCEMVSALERMRQPDGLYAPPCSAFIDHGRRVTTGSTAAFNAAVVAGLRAMAEIGRCAGATVAAAPLDARAAELEVRLPAAYFDASAGMFRDLPPDGGLRATEGSPAIVWPLLFAPATRGLAPAALPALRRMLDGFVADHEAKSVSPYQMFYLLALLRTLGEAELAETTIRRVYAEMLTHPTGTLWERARSDSSLVHAWSCAVNDYFATAVLGVRLGFEGADELTTIQVRPCAATLTWARGVVPHPRGDVSVEWRREGDRLHVTVRAPAGVPVAVQPAGPLAGLPCEMVRGEAGAR